MEEWGAWFRGQRLLTGVALAEMQRRTRIDEHVIRQIEQGKRMAVPRTQARLLVALGLPTEMAPVTIKQRRGATGAWWKDPEKRARARAKMTASHLARHARMRAREACA